MKATTKQTDTTAGRIELAKVDFLNLVMLIDASDLEVKIVNTWNEIFASGNNMEKLKAAEQILAYKYGRPKQIVDIQTKGNSLEAGVFVNQLKG